MAAIYTRPEIPILIRPTIDEIVALRKLRPLLIERKKSPSFVTLYNEIGWFSKINQNRIFNMVHDIIERCVFPKPGAVEYMLIMGNLENNILHWHIVSFLLDYLSEDGSFPSCLTLSFSSISDNTCRYMALELFSTTNTTFLTELDVLHTTSFLNTFDQNDFFVIHCHGMLRNQIRLECTPSRYNDFSDTDSDSLG